MHAGTRRCVARACLALAGLSLGLSFSPIVRAQDGDGVDGSPPVLKAKPTAPGDQASATSQTIRVQSLLVTTPVTVINRSGDFVSDLAQKEFTVYDNGERQSIQRFELASDPIALVILVQTNDTIGSLLYQVRPLGSMFADLVVGPSGQAAVISFSDKVRLLQDFSGDRDKLKTTLQQLEVLGSPARLNDALMRAMAMLEARPNTERRIIVVFSDGTDHGSENDRAVVIRRATGDEVTIYGLHLSRAEALLRQKPEDQPMDPLDANVTRPLPPGVVPTATNSANVWGTPVPGVPILTAAGDTISSVLTKTLLESYAGFTGGVYYSHWTNTALQDQLDRIASEVHTQYEIAYKPTTLAEDGFHRIEIEVGRPGLRVRARAGYFYQK
ncbi:MAG TPA: VWA domain-containing protein [Terriglobia bacterium]|nr:VWA domain-containing protein [Terriglobia bacterium]